VRNPIQVQATLVDLDKYQSRLDEIRDNFSRYLQYYRAKSPASKHGLMGPVGKVLREAKSGRADPQYLKGYVLRVHETAQKGAPPTEAVSAVEKGIDGLTGLLRELPVAAHDKLIDRLDYGLYLALRKKFIGWIEERDNKYRSFLRDKYSELDVLNRAWKKDFKSWDLIRFGGPSSATYKKASAGQRNDMDKFAQHLKDLGKEDVLESAEEELA